MSALPGALDRMTGVINGLFGGWVGAGSGQHAPEMTVRNDHRRVEMDHAALATAFPDATTTLVVFPHGLIETERGWFRGRAGSDFGARFADDVRYSPVYVRYHSGRHVSDNGRELVGVLSQLIAEWPMPVTRVVLIGHSMGGLVARSALHQTSERHEWWLPRVTGLICLGTPHTGAPLERQIAGIAALLGRNIVASPLTWLLALRSEGIQDLAHGFVHQRQWLPDEATAPVEDPSGLPATIRQLYVSATISRKEGSTWGP